MSLEFDIAKETHTLEVINGVAAFDCVTMRVAADELSKLKLTVHTQNVLAGKIPKHLGDLAQIKYREEEITVTIDTSIMKWDTSVNDEPSADDFTDYTGKQIYAVDLGELDVLHNKDIPITTRNMILPNKQVVTVWFAEVKKPLKDFTGFDLLDFANTQIAYWNANAEDKAISRKIYIPAQDLKYKTKASGVEIEEWPFTFIEQKFAFTMDETGARVIASTSMFGCLPPAAEPAEQKFGETGPVIVWFTDETSNMPFSIFYTESEAWLDPDWEGDLENLTLPE